MTTIVNKKTYGLKLDGNVVALTNTAGEHLLSFPVGVRIKYEGGETNIKEPLVSFDNDVITVTDADCEKEIAFKKLTLILKEDSIITDFEMAFNRYCSIYETEYFREDWKGLYMIDCINYFCPQPFNFDGINSAFNKNFCSGSMNGYFTPPPLNFSVGNRSGWVSFGLLDLPDSYEYQLTKNLGVLAEKPWGNLKLKKGEVYKAPRLVLTFPEDEWQGIALFREKLIENGVYIPKNNRKEFPEWWNNPLVVTYGDQMLQIQYNWYNDSDLDSAAFNQEWLTNWLDKAEQRLGFTNFTVIVDAFWQYRHTPEGRPEESRFPDFRGFIDECHRRGHKVILWTCPLICRPREQFESLAEKYDMLTDIETLSPADVVGSRTKKIDFTSNNAPLYFKELAQRFFGSGEGELDCDGLKLDYLAVLHNPTDGDYRNPENGLGIKEMYRFYELFNAAAKEVKPDVLLNGSTCDPRFENVVHMNRLHDIQKVYKERDQRAKISSLACPDMLIDSDGAIMIGEWVEETYIKAVLYSTPSLYYIDMFHDRVRFSDEKMKQLGDLLQLSAKKLSGVPKQLENGDWELCLDGKVVGRTYGGHTVLLLGKDGKYYLFSWKEEIAIPVFDEDMLVGISNLEVKDGILQGSVEAGEVLVLERRH